MHVGRKRHEVRTITLNQGQDLDWRLDDEGIIQLDWIWIWSARNDCGETGETWATGVDEESLDSGHTPGIDERGKSQVCRATDFDWKLR